MKGLHEKEGTSQVHQGDEDFWGTRMSQYLLLGLWLPKLTVTHAAFS
jgi:hypothetical protein